MMKVLIRIDKLSKYYSKGGEIKAADDLDLEVHEGETFGFMSHFRRVGCWGFYSSTLEKEGLAESNRIVKHDAMYRQ